MAKSDWRPDNDFKIGSGGFNRASGLFFRGRWGEWLRSFDQGDGKPFPWLGTGGSLGLGLRAPLAIAAVGFWLLAGGVFTLVSAVLAADWGGAGLVIFLALVGLFLLGLGGIAAVGGWAQHRWAVRNGVVFSGERIGAVAILLGLPIIFVLIRLLS